MWNPQEDITLEDLAKCLPLLIVIYTGGNKEAQKLLHCDLPIHAKRHWKVLQ